MRSRTMCTREKATLVDSTRSVLYRIGTPASYLVITKRGDRWCRIYAHCHGTTSSQQHIFVCGSHFQKMEGWMHLLPFFSSSDRCHLGVVCQRLSHHYYIWMFGIYMFFFVFHITTIFEHFCITVANHRLITVIRFVAKSYTHFWRGFANRLHLVVLAYKIFS